MALFSRLHSLQRLISPTNIRSVHNINKFNDRIFKSISTPSIRRNVSVAQPLQNKETVEVTFLRASGERITAKGKEGDSILDLVVNNEVDLDGFGACEGTLTCSTCHVILSQADYDRLPNKPTDEELDMLDLAFDLTDTSRLGCQITLTKELNKLEVKVPATINDARK